LILVPTESARGSIKEKVGVPTAVFARGVDCEEFGPHHRARREGDGELRSLFVGRISVEKNLSLFTKLATTGGRGLVFVGDGPYKGYLQQQLPEAIFPGFLRGGDLARAYASADIFAFPSKTETFGNAVLEAMASGLPVLVTDVGGPKDFVVDGENGLVARSDAEFIDLHRQLTDDEELRSRLGRKAREFALTCEWDRIFESQVLGSYRKVIAEWAGSPQS
jgi:glycosyltransferase involved in cell wall biosynthesis